MALVHLLRLQREMRHAENMPVEQNPLIRIVCYITLLRANEMRGFLL